MNIFSPKQMGRSNQVAALIGVLGLLPGLLGASRAAAEPLAASARQQIQALVAEKESRTPTQRKMDSQLVYALRLSRGQPVAQGVTLSRVGAQADADGALLVDVDATVTPELIEFIQQAGGRILNQFPQFRSIRARVPLAFTETLAARPEVKFVQPAVEAMTRTGSINSQGDRTHRADDGRFIFGATGADIKVGVLSDSVDYLPNSQATGDLPPNVTILPGQSGIPGSGEGTAMLEIVHDLAPDAELFFASGFNGPASFAQNIINLRAAGCEIIVDDIYYFNESPFQDAVIARAVNQVTAGGSLYFSSAGNAGNLKSGTSGTWQGDFVDGGAVGAPVDEKGGLLHSFGNGTYNTVTMPGSAATLFWSDPLGASTNDYDLFVLNEAGDEVVTSSTTTQNGGQDPYEMAWATAPGQRIVVVKASGDARLLYIDTIAGQLAVATEGNTKGHSAATNAFSVAAVDAHDAYPNPFAAGNIVESISSDGPRHVFYHADGTPITPGDLLSTGGYVRQKPDIAAADGVATATPGFNPFYGTSAAAPHAAAIAALLLSHNPSLTPAQVRTLLTSTAIDIEAPGYDINAGAGIVMAFQALQITPPMPRVRLRMVTNAISGGNGNGMIDFNECNDLSIIITNAGELDAMSSQMTLSTVTPGVAVMSSTSVLPPLMAGASGSNTPPFKVTTAPDFVCGTPVDFTLVIKSDQVTVTNRFRVETGERGTVVRFDGFGPWPIPDADVVGTHSPALVSDIVGAVGKVAVSVHIQHTFLSDLKLELVAPDGTTCLLADGVGSSGDNFGTACSPDTSRTLFDDDATNSIRGGSAPFVGSFRPDQPLAIFAGKSGVAVNGLWQLHVVDSFFFDTGTIQCWSLHLSPATCNDGGGTCPGTDLALSLSDAPDPAVTQSNFVYTINVTNLGPNLAKGAVVTHQLPTNVAYLASVSTRGNVSEAGGIVTASLGNLPVGGTAIIGVTVKALSLGELLSSATIASTEPEINPPNNSANARTIVLPASADLSVSLNGTPNPVTVGGSLTYSCRAINNGPVAAGDVIISNAFPATVRIVGVTTSRGTAQIGGNVIITSVGTLTNGEAATLTITAVPLAEGTLVAVARVSSSMSDPLPANDFTTASVVVGPAADLAVSLVDQPDPVVISSNFTYLVTVTNRGPSVAGTVAVNQTLPGGDYRVVGTSASQGSASIGGNVLSWNVGSLASGAAATLTVVGNSTSEGTLIASATVTAATADPSATDNTATATTLVAKSFLSIVGAGAGVATESITPPNGAIDSGETVTVSFRLRNAGNVNNTNLVATLLASGGVTPITTSQSYGVLPAGGGLDSRPFSFSASGAAGSTITARLQLRDGPNHLPDVLFTFVLPQVTHFANTAAITIPDSGAAEPYPSTINVAGVVGIVGRIGVTLSNMTHTFVRDVDLLLVGPLGQKVVLMGAAGGEFGVTNTTFTIDDTAADVLPETDQILAATYRPVSYNPALAFPGNAPAEPYDTALSTFSSLDPNGTWSLYVADHTPGDHGSILSGWSLAVQTITPVNNLADLVLLPVATPNPVRVGDQQTLTFTVTNAGPSAANGVYFTNQVPAGLELVSAGASQGDCTVNGTTVSALLGTLNAGASATVTLVLTPLVVGNTTNSAAVSAFESDLNAANNVASPVTAAVMPAADLAVTQLSDTPAAIVGSNVTFTVVVQNQGPDSALDVKLTNQLSGFVVGSVSLSSGSYVVSNGMVVCSFGKLASGAAATATLVAKASLAGSGSNTAVVNTASADPVAANNTAVASVPTTDPRPLLEAAGVKVIAETNGIANGALEPGETVTLALTLRNVGQLGTSNLLATLLAGDGVADPDLAQTYGVTVAGGVPVTREFRFRCVSTPDNTVTVRLALSEGGASLNNEVQYVFTSLHTLSFTNFGAIVIPDRGAAAPYPSTITVSGVTGQITKATAALHQFTHGFPSDVDVLLAGPRGQKLVLQSDAGGGWSVTNVMLNFEDELTVFLPEKTPLVAGGYKPTDYLPGDVFPAPAPRGERGSQLSTFNGTDPNGFWSLYVNDASVGDGGVIAEGWTLSLTIATPINPLANLRLDAASAPGDVLGGAAVTYTLRVTNAGPATASAASVVAKLPELAEFVSASAGQGTFTNESGQVTFNLGALALGTFTEMSIVLRPAAAGNATVSASAVALETDLDPSDNTASATTTVTIVAPATLGGAYYDTANNAFVLILTGQPGGDYALLASPDLKTWTGVATNTASTSGTIKFTDPLAPAFIQRYYRAVWLAP